jgi:hypothetical protein
MHCLIPVVACIPLQGCEDQGKHHLPILGHKAHKMVVVPQEKRPLCHLNIETNIHTMISFHIYLYLNEVLLPWTDIVTESDISKKYMRECREDSIEILLSIPAKAKLT